MLENKEWKLIVDKTPLAGSWNMAADEYLFRSLSERPKTYLRFYQWKRPTVSLGYSQNIHKVLDVDFCLKHGIDIVRRITGGKLVLHHKEITYSVCSSDVETFTSKLSDSYRLISEALMLGLMKMGLASILSADPPSVYARGDLPCFSYPARNEIELNGKKIIGSAQKRIRSRFIQHGSIPLEEDEALLESVSRLKEGEERVRMTSLSQALGTKVSFESAAEYLKAGFSEYFGMNLNPRTFDEKEKEAISEIQKQRYESRDWTFFRRNG